MMAVKIRNFIKIPDKMIKLKLLLFVMCAGLAAGAQEKMTPQNIRPSRQRFTPDETAGRNSVIPKLILEYCFDIPNRQVHSYWLANTLNRNVFKYDYFRFHNPVPTVKEVNLLPRRSY
jgi:hypothetical protein